MDNHSELFNEFAKVINVLVPSMERGVADDFAKLTAPSENKPGSFMYCESNTWRLLSVLSRNKDKSKLSQISAIKQWVSEIPKDQDLLDLILEDEEIENQVQNMFKRRAGTEDEQPKKRRLIETSNENGRTTFKQQFITTDEKEQIYKKQFEKLRYNDLTPIDIKANREVSHNYMYNMYCEYQQRALDDTAGKIIKRERDVWRETVKHELQENSNGKYRIALYDVLSGNADDLYNSVCDTWEDIIWAYLNSKVENMLDEPEKSNDDPIITTDVISIASAKDRIMFKDDPRIIFHHIQAAILSGTTEIVIKKIYLALTEKGTQSSSTFFKISDDAYFRSHLLRFISTLILYGIEYLGWKENKYSVALLGAYTDLNGKEDSLRPIVVASYTAKQSPENQIQIYSNFLQKFVGDDEESTILVQLGKEYGLDMPDILRYTFTQLFEKAIANANAQILSKPSKFETTGEITPADEPFFKAVKWLIYDPLMCQQAFKAANMVMRYFLGIGKIYLVTRVCEIIPEMLMSHMFVASKENEEAARTVKEFRLNASLAKSITLYDSFKKDLKEEPKDDGSYAGLLKVINWKDEIEKKSIDITSLIFDFLEQNWLEKDEDELDFISNKQLKEIYIPEAIIMYHQVLVQSSKIIPSNAEKAKRLNIFITQKHKNLFETVKNANRATDVLDELSTSLALFK